MNVDKEEPSDIKEHQVASQEEVVEEGKVTINVKQDTNNVDDSTPSVKGKKTRGNLKHSLTIDEGETKSKDAHQAAPVGNFFSVCLVGSIEKGEFKSVNDVYIRYSIIAGPDWIINTGLDVGITQISRYDLKGDGRRHFVWNQPIAISYISYNFHGWPQLVLSAYHFDTFGNDQILGYGSIHLPCSSSIRTNHTQTIRIYAPQSSSFLGRMISWFTGKNPELVDSNLFARSDCRSVLQMKTVGTVNITFNLITKDVTTYGYRS